MTTSNGVLGRRTRCLAGLVLAAALLAGCATSVAGTASPVAGALVSPGSSAPTSLPAGSGTPSSDAPSSDTPSSEAPSSEAPSSDAPSTDAPSSDAPSSEPSTEASDPSSSEPADQTGTVDPAAFAAKLQSANGKVTSVTGAIGVDSTAATVKGTFKESLAAGKVNAIDMKMTVGVNDENVAFNLLIKDNKVYLGGTTIMSSLGAGDKKWALATETSSNTQLRTLAGQLDGYLDTASADQYTLFARAASSVKDAGEQPLGSITAHRYEVTVDTAKAAALMTGASKTSMQTALDAGVKTVPTTIWLDDKDRLVEADSTIALRGVKSTTTFKVTDYDTEVVITAPAAKDVYTG